MRSAEQGYVNALTRYRQLLEAGGGDEGSGDPRARFAALEYLVAASQAGSWLEDQLNPHLTPSTEPTLHRMIMTAMAIYTDPTK